MKNKISQPTDRPLTEREKTAEKIVKNRKKNPNFPKKAGSRKLKPVILDSHREIFQLYKDQGFRNLGKAIRRTGVYSEGLAQRVNVLTKTRSWQALMQEYLPESTIAIRHAELLDKRDYRKVPTGDVDEMGKQIMMEVDNGPETLAVSKGLELAYRLRGAFQKEEAAPPSTVMYNLFYKPEVMEQVKAFEDRLKIALTNEISKKNKADADAGIPSTEGGTVKEGISGSANLNN